MPEINVPPRGLHIWQWYFDACEIRSDHCEVITANDWTSWKELTGAIVHSREWRILREMDKSYVCEMRKERQDLNVRLAEKQNGGRS